MVFVVSVFCILIVPSGAKAYLDPGTGSFAVQIIIAAFATFFLSVKLFWGKIRNLISRSLQSFHAKRGK